MTLPLSAADQARIAEIAEIESRLPAAIGELVARLDDPSWPVRRVAVAALARAGNVAVAPLLEVLVHGRASETRIAAAVDALSASTADVDDALIALGDRSPTAVACDAAQILGRRRSTTAVEALARWVGHDDDNLSVAAIEALGRIGGGAGVEAVIAAALSGRFFRTHPAIDVLARSGDPRAIAPLEQLLGDPLCGPEAARALGRIGDVGTVSALARKLASGTASMTRVAALSLVEVVDVLGARVGSREGIVAALRAGAGDPAAAAFAVSQALPGSDSVERVALARVLGWLAEGDSAGALVELLPEGGAVARAAADALASLGPSAHASLLFALRNATSELRALLLPLLTPAARAEPEVAACIDDPDPAVRAIACATAARIGSTSAVPRLFAHLGDPDTKVAQAALAAIQVLGHASTESLTLAAARDSSAQVRRAALRLLGAFGWPSALEPLEEAARGGDPRLADAAIASLAFVDDPRAAPTLIDLSRSPADRARASAVRAMGHLQPAPELVARLEEALSDPMPWVRYYAAQALGRLRSTASVPVLSRLLADPAGHVRIAVIEALARLSDASSASALVDAARDGDPDLRRAALVGLGIARPPAARGVLLEAIDDPDPSTRMVALGSLASFEGEDVLNALSRAARGDDGDVRAAAIGALASMAGRDATRALLELAQHDVLSPAALTALASPVAGRIPALLEALEGAGPDLAAKLTSVLARMQRPDAHAALAVALATSWSIHTRRAAAAALAALASRETVAHLERALADDADAEVRRLAALGLARR